MRNPAGRRAAFGAALLLLLLSVLFWKLRIFDSGIDHAINLVSVDLYIADTPADIYGFGMLKRGHLPLWNPYQFCGEPFFAVAYVGLLYPPQWINLFFDVLTSFEISFIAHMFFGGLSMWWLARHFGVGMLGALCGAVTFMWSGWMILNNTLPGIFYGMTWMPLTVLLLDYVLGGRRWAWLWLILAIACQLLNGYPEVCVHAVYVGGLFMLCRIVQMSWRGDGRGAARGVAVIVVCGITALLLVALQLFPAVELTQQSVRAAGSLDFAQALRISIPASQFLRDAVHGTGAVTVGVLPVVGLALILGYRRLQVVWIAGLIAAILAALLVFGGPVYRLYYSIPVIGSLFRRAVKFLDIYAFAQAVLVGVAVTRLDEWADSPRSQIWRHPAWLACLALNGAAIYWLLMNGTVPWYWFGAVGGLLLFGALPASSARRAVLTAICVVQAASLFFTVGNTYVRPVKRPGIFRAYQQVFDLLKVGLGDSRVYLSSNLFFWFPGLTSKQGLLNKMPVTIDYEPLALQRYGRFFTTITPRTDPRPFVGVYDLQPQSRWRLMDLTGTKYFVMHPGEPGDIFMAANPAEFRVVYDKAPVRVFEKHRVIPRAYFVSQARVLNGADEVLAALDDPRFNPRAEVLFEQPVAQPPFDASGLAVRSRVRITSYEPERVVLEAEVQTPGFLVLHDVFYPGWKAFVDDREVPIERADYLFRAVRLDPGRAVVRFEYRPASFRTGIIVSVCTALVIVIAVFWGARRRTGAALCDE